MSMPINSYASAISTLGSVVQQGSTLLPNFNTAKPMKYAEQSGFNGEDLSDELIAKVQELQGALSEIAPDPNLAFTTGQTVYIPDIHCDLDSLLIVLYRHGLLDNDFDLKTDYNYIFLGDFYDENPGADVLDYWVNKQIEKEITIRRLVGNHELGALTFVPFNGLYYKDDKNNTAQIGGLPFLESLLENIRDGVMLAAYVEFDDNVPILSAHSYITEGDMSFARATDVLDFARIANERLQRLGEEAYDVFDKNRDMKLPALRRTVSDVIQSDFLFDIAREDVFTGEHKSFTQRRTFHLNDELGFLQHIHQALPKGVYQRVGHTPLGAFWEMTDNPFQPLIVPAENMTAAVEFTDLGLGRVSGQKKILRRMRGTINPQQARVTEKLEKHSVLYTDLKS